MGITRPRPDGGVIKVSTDERLDSLPEAGKKNPTCQRMIEIDSS